LRDSAALTRSAIPAFCQASRRFPALDIDPVQALALSENNARPRLFFAIDRKR
jgi:hypothetical protein